MENAVIRARNEEERGYVRCESKENTLSRHHHGDLRLFVGYHRDSIVTNQGMKMAQRFAALHGHAVTTNKESSNVCKEGWGFIIFLYCLYCRRRCYGLGRAKQHWRQSCRRAMRGGFNRVMLAGVDQRMKGFLVGQVADRVWDLMKSQRSVRCVRVCVCPMREAWSTEALPYSISRSVNPEVPAPRDPRVL